MPRRGRAHFASLLTLIGDWGHSDLGSLLLFFVSHLGGVLGLSHLGGFPALGNLPFRMHKGSAGKVAFDKGICLYKEVYLGKISGHSISLYVMHRDRCQMSLYSGVE